MSTDCACLYVPCRVLLIVQSGHYNCMPVACLRNVSIPITLTEIMGSLPDPEHAVRFTSVTVVNRDSGVMVIDWHACIRPLHTRCPCYGCKPEYQDESICARLPYRPRIRDCPYYSSSCFFRTAIGTPGIEAFRTRFRTGF